MRIPRKMRNLKIQMKPRTLKEAKPWCNFQAARNGQTVLRPE